jgi:hypothetical protein
MAEVTQISFKKLLDQMKKDKESEEKKIDADLKKQQISDKKNLKELELKLKKASDENTKELLESQIESIKANQESNQVQKDFKSKAVKELELQKTVLEQMRQQLEDNGEVAESNIEYQEKAKEIRKTDLNLKTKSFTIEAKAVAEQTLILETLKSSLESEGKNAESNKKYQKETKKLRALELVKSQKEDKFKSLDRKKLDKSLLFQEETKKSLELQGKVAEDNLDYQKLANENRIKELQLNKKESDPSLKGAVGIKISNTLLEQISKGITEQGGVATDTKGFIKKSLDNDQKALNLRKKVASEGKMSASGKEEIEKEQYRINKERGTMMGKMANGITDMKNGFKKGIGVAGKGLLAGALFIALGVFFQSKYFKMITDMIYDTIVPGLKAVWGLFEGFSSLFGMGPGSMLGILGGLVVGGVVAVKIVRGIKALVAAFKAVQVFMATEMVMGIRASVSGAGAKLMKVIRMIGPAITTLRVFMMTSFLPAIIGMASSFAAMMIPFLPIIAIVAAIAAVGYALFEGIKTFFERFEETGSIIEGISAAIGSFIGTILGIIPTAIQKAIVWIAELFGFDDFAKWLDSIDIIGEISSGIESAINGVINFFTGIFDNLFSVFKGTGEGLVDSIANGIGTFIGTILGIIPDAIKNVISWIARLFGFDDFAKWLDSFSVIDMISGGIKDGINALVDWFGGLFDIDFKKLAIAILPSWTPNIVKNLFGVGDKEEKETAEEFSSADKALRKTKEEEIAELNKEHAENEKLRKRKKEIKDKLFKGEYGSFLGIGDSEEDLQNELKSIEEKQNTKVLQKKLDTGTLKIEKLDGFDSKEATHTMPDGTVMKGAKHKEDVKLESVDLTKYDAPIRDLFKQLDKAKKNRLGKGKEGALEFSIKRLSKKRAKELGEQYKNPITERSNLQAEERRNLKDTKLKNRIGEKRFAEVKKLNKAIADEFADNDFTKGGIKYDKLVKTRDDIISGKLKSIKGDVGQSIGDNVTPTPTNKSDGAPVIVNAPSTTNAPVNNNSTNVTSSSFVEPDGMFRRNSQFAL